MGSPERRGERPKGGERVGEEERGKPEREGERKGKDRRSVLGNKNLRLTYSPGPLSNGVTDACLNLPGNLPSEKDRLAKRAMISEKTD